MSIKPLTVKEEGPAKTTATRAPAVVKPSSPQVSQPSAMPKQKLILSDELGKLIQDATKLVETSASFGDFIRAAQGPSDLYKDVKNLDHPTA